MSQKRTYQQYPREYKEEAVALVTDQGYSVPQGSKSLGINPIYSTSGNRNLKLRFRVSRFLSPSEMSLNVCVEKTKNCGWRKRF
jgi:transposase